MNEHQALFVNEISFRLFRREVVMAEDLSSGGAVGAIMGEMAKQALQGEEFRPTLERNIETLNSLAPLVEEMKKYNEMLDRPREEIERLQSHITEGKELVKKSNNLSRSSEEEYQSKLQKKDVQAESRGDLMEVLSHERQDLEILLSKENQISGLNTGDLMEGLSHERQIFEMGETAKQALQTVKKGIEFRPTLERNTETLMVEDMTKHNEMLDCPIEEIERLQSHITEGKELVKKSNNLSRSSEEEYQSKLQEKDVQAENRGDLMEVLSSVRQNLEILPERKRDLLSDSASFASRDHDHDTEIETMASAMVEVDEVDEESNIHNISWQKGKILGEGSLALTPKVHSKMCTEMMKLVDSISRIFPGIKEACQRCSSGIGSLCLLNNAIDKAKLLLQHCSECSKLYLAVTGDTVLSRFQKATRSLEQSLIPIQGMVPVMLVAEVSRIIDDLQCATFVLDSAEEEAGRVITKLLQQGTSTAESVDDSEVKALQFAAPRLNITSAKAILIEKRSIKKLLDNVGPNDQKKKMILRYLMYLLKKHGNFMVREQMEKVYSRREEPIAMENSHRNSLRSHHVESDPSLSYGQYRVTPPEEYKCPISSKLMYDPVVIASGVTYERMWIKKWFDEGKTICPETKKELPHMALAPNVVMKDLISKWCKINGVSIPDPSWQEEKVHSWETSNTSIKSFGSYFNDLSLPVDLTNMSLGSLDSSFSSDVSRVKSTTHSSNLIKTGENSHKHRAREEIRDTDLMLLPNLHDLQWDSQCKVIEDMKDHLKSNSQAMISVSAEDFVEPLVRFLSNANDLQDVKALRAGTQLLLEFVNNCRNGMANLSEDTFIKLASLLESEVIGEVLAIMEELSGDGNSKAKIAASSALTSVLKSLDSDNKGFQQQAIRIMYNLSFNTEVCLHMVSLNCIPKLLPFFKDTAVLRYCIYILKNICDTEEGRNSIAETKGCLSSVAEILETGSNEEQEHALAVLVSLCSQNVDYCKLVMGEDIITPLFFISQNGNDKGKESALELICLLRDTKYVENEDCSSEPITNNNSVDSNSRHEENKSSKRKPFLKKLSLFSKSSSHA